MTTGTIGQRITALAAAGLLTVGVATNQPNEYTEPGARTGEVTALRTENSYTVRMHDGQMRAQVHSGAIHWRDGSEWKRPDLEVKARPWLLRAVSEYEAEVTAGAWTAKLDQENPANYRMETPDGGWIALELTTKGATADLKTETWGIKEYVTIEAGGPDVLTWTVTGNETPAWDGATLTVPGLETLPLTAWDAGGKPVGLKVLYEKGTLTAVVDTVGVKWPVTVDPSTTISAVLDGYVYAAAATYEAARDKATGTGAETTSIYVGTDVTSKIVYRSFLTFPNTLSATDLISVDACTLYVYGAYNESTQDDSLYVVGAESYGPTLDTGDMDSFNGWAASGTYTGVKLTYGWHTSAYSAAYNGMVFTPAGRDSLKTTAGDTLRIAMLSRMDYLGSTPSGISYLQFRASAEANDPYLSITYTNYSYNTTYTNDYSLLSYQTQKANKNATYLTVRNSVVPESITSTAADTLGQWKDGANDYHVYRQTFYVPIRKMNHVDAASMVFTGAADGSTTDFTITAVKGLWGNVVSDDFRYTYVNADTTARYGTLSTAGFNAAGADSLVFDATGRAAIITASEDTLFVTLFSNLDIAGTAPTGAEYVAVNPAGAVLRVTWALNDSIPADVAVAAIATEPDSLVVTWRDRTLDETGFAVVDSTTGATLATVSAGVQVARIGGLIPNTRYSWRVKVVGGTYADSLSAADYAYTAAGAPTTAPGVIARLDTLLVMVSACSTGTGNPAVTEYALQDSISGLYVDWTATPDTLKSGAVWGTITNWGDTARVAVERGRRYGMRAKARNIE